MLGAVKGEVIGIIEGEPFDFYKIRKNGKIYELSKLKCTIEGGDAWFHPSLMEKIKILINKKKKSK